MKTCQFLFGRLLPLAVFLLLLSEGTASAAGLQEKIDQILKKSGLLRGQVSLQIVSLPEGTLLYDRNSGLPLNPASNVKLVTAAAALRELGTDFTFKTEFYSDTLIKGGKIHNLWIKGFGDPLFVTEEMESVADRFVQSGLREISGQVFVDDTYFDRNNLTTYLSDWSEKIYSIVTGPLSFNFNSIEIRARPGRRAGDQPIIRIDPPTRYVNVTNIARTTGRGSAPALEARLKNEGEIQVVGSIPRTIREYSFRRGILDPATYTGTVLMEALENRGVRIAGGLRREAVPARGLLILSHSSPPLREILKGLGKFSNNFIAEQLVKTLAAVRHGPPGSTPKGLEILKNYLVSLGILPSSFTLDNGSGLSKLTRLSSGQLVRVLLDLYKSPAREALISSLSVAGVDGTMKSKMRKSPLRGKVFGKTGTLNGVSALSGYLMDEKKQAAFSFLWNDFPFSTEKVIRTEQAILEAVLPEL